MKLPQYPAFGTFGETMPSITLADSRCRSREVIDTARTASIRAKAGSVLTSHSHTSWDEHNCGRVIYPGLSESPLVECSASRSRQHLIQRAQGPSGSRGSVTR